MAKRLYFGAKELDKVEKKYRLLDEGSKSAIRDKIDMYYKKCLDSLFTAGEALTDFENDVEREIGGLPRIIKSCFRVIFLGILAGKERGDYARKSEELKKFGEEILRRGLTNAPRG